MSTIHDGRNPLVGGRTQRLGRHLALVLFLVGAAGLAPQPAQAAPKPKPAKNSIRLIPTIQSITRDPVTGQLLASGVATAVINGQTVTAPFTAPVNISLAADQSAAQAGCPILDLALGPINLNLLGLVVETSPICLQITAYEGGGLLGDLLCSVANLLSGGLPLNAVLDLLQVGGQLGDLTAGLQNLLNAGLARLVRAVLTAILPAVAPGTCSILHLELGPLELTLLGLEVILDDCDGGPVVVDVTGQEGQLLGDLLCGLLGGGGIDLGTTLQGILQRLLGLLG